MGNRMLITNVLPAQCDFGHFDVELQQRSQPGIDNRPSIAVPDKPVDMRNSLVPISDSEAARHSAFREVAATDIIQTGDSPKGRRHNDCGRIIIVASVDDVECQLGIVATDGPDQFLV